MKMKTLIPAIAMAVTPAAFAQDTEKTQGFYIAPEVGFARLADWCKDLRKAAIGTAVVFTKCEESGFAIGSFFGYQFNEIFAAEAGFNYAGGFEVVVNDVATIEADLVNFKVGGRAFAPISDVFSFTGKVGAHFWKTETEGTAGNVTFSETDDGTDIYFGIGGKAAVSNDISILAEWTRYAVDEVDADVFSVGAVISF